MLLTGVLQVAVTSCVLLAETGQSLLSVPQSIVTRLSAKHLLVELLLFQSQCLVRLLLLQQAWTPV